MFDIKLLEPYKKYFKILDLNDIRISVGMDWMMLEYTVYISSFREKFDRVVMRNSFDFHEQIPYFMKDNLSIPDVILNLSTMKNYPLKKRIQYYIFQNEYKELYEIYKKHGADFTNDVLLILMLQTKINGGKLW